MGHNTPSRSANHSRGGAIWNASQRGVLIAFVLILCCVLAVRLWRNGRYVSDPQPVHPERYDELRAQLDPNVASVQQLSVLPQLGEKRAKEIVAYREQFRADRRGETPFHSADDLLKVRGIGVAMLETLRPHLMFPATRVATTRLTG